MPVFTQNLEKLNFLNEEIPIHNIDTLYGKINFLMFGKTTEFRVRTFFTKEPETLAWIDGFRPGDALWDIGANIGCYSLYAASKNCKVCAFEPSAINFWLLSANAAINKFSDKLVSYPFALSDNSGVVEWSPNMSPASANNQLIQENAVCVGGGAVQAYSIDALIEMNSALFPNHVKLDVDGIEYLILSGAKKTLKDMRLLSIMVEVNENDHKTTEAIVDLLIQSGFKKPVTRHSPYFNDNYYLPSCNYLFLRA